MTNPIFIFYFMKSLGYTAGFYVSTLIIIIICGIIKLVHSMISKSKSRKERADLENKVRQQEIVIKELLAK